MIRQRCLVVMLLGIATLAPAADAPPEWQLHRPEVPGTLRLHLRERRVEGGAVRVIERDADWKAAETAIIVCDMWEDGYCRVAAQRVSAMVPRMNELLWVARDRGVMIIHAPSNTVNMYADTPQRLRMKNAEPVKPPVAIRPWCDLDPSREPTLPLETKVSPCDDPITGTIIKKYSRQHPGMDIVGFDGISDDGGEIFSYCRRRGIKNIALLGVHANMCVLGRSFGVRQLTALGFDVALVRDQTDVMYDSRQPPYVSHARATELIVEHIEAYWCPSFESKDFANLVPGSAGPVSPRERAEHP